MVVTLWCFIIDLYTNVFDIPAFSNSSTAEEGTFVTNSIPKSMNHTKILEKAMNDILAKWTSQSGELNVVTGPAFDFLATGTRPQIGRLMWVF